MDFGKVLRKMRKSAGLSQEEIALEMNMSRSNVAKLETDRIELKAVDLINWCRITNNPDVLMALYMGAEITIQLQPVTQLITGFVSILGGIL